MIIGGSFVAALILVQVPRILASNEGDSAGAFAQVLVLASAVPITVGGLLLILWLRRKRRIVRRRTLARQSPAAIVVNVEHFGILGETESAIADHQGSYVDTNIVDFTLVASDKSLELWGDVEGPPTISWAWSDIESIEVDPSSYSRGSAGAISLTMRSNLSRVILILDGRVRNSFLSNQRDAMQLVEDLSQTRPSQRSR